MLKLRHFFILLIFSTISINVFTAAHKSQQNKVDAEIAFIKKEYPNLEDVFEKLNIKKNNIRSIYYKQHPSVRHVEQFISLQEQEKSNNFIISIITIELNEQSNAPHQYRKFKGAPQFENVTWDVLIMKDNKGNIEYQAKQKYGTSEKQPDVIIPGPKKIVS